MNAKVAIILFEVLFLVISVALVVLQIFLIKRSQKAMKAKKGFGPFNLFGIAASSLVLIFFAVFILINLYFLSRSLSTVIYP